MATRDEIRWAFARVSAVFPMAGHETAESLLMLLQVWNEVLADIPSHVLSAAVTQRLSEPREWRPTPGQVRDTCISIMSPQHPLPHEAINDHNDPLAASVHSGFKRWEWTDEPNKTRMRFMKCYREALEREARALRLHPTTIRAIEDHSTPGFTPQIEHEIRPSEATTRGARTLDGYLVSSAEKFGSIVVSALTKTPPAPVKEGDS